MKKLRVLAGWSALILAAASSVIALTVRDGMTASAVLFFGIPWLVRLVAAVIAIFLLKPQRLFPRALVGLVILHSLMEGWRSFHWRDEPPPVANGFDITLWNAEHKLHRMPDQWPLLIGPETKLVVITESGQFPKETREKFAASHPAFTWNHLQGEIIIGVRGLYLGGERIPGYPSQTCHRVRVIIDRTAYTVIANDIPSPPLVPRTPYLDRVRESAPTERCLILGDFNTQPSAKGYDAWRKNFSLANEAHSRGFQETWLYGLPVLTLDQLWISRDLRTLKVTNSPGFKSDHNRMTFRIAPAR